LVAVSKLGSSDTYWSTTTPPVKKKTILVNEILLSVASLSYLSDVKKHSV